MADVVLPPLAEGVDKASVTYWHKSIGQSVREGEDLVELVTDKATFNMPSPKTGLVRQIMVQEGEQASVGQIIAVIE